MLGRNSIAILGLLALFTGQVCNAAPTHYQASVIEKREQTTAWKFNFQDDFFAPIRNNDNNYSFGFTAIETGKAAKRSYMSVEPAINWLDSILQIKGKATDQSNAIGFYGFTPNNNGSARPNYNDRPYASMVYLKSSHFRVGSDQRQALFSSFTVGVYGLPVSGNIQNAIHQTIGNDKLKGWDNQISNGGEPTLRYELAYQQNIVPLSDIIELKHSIGGSFGYVTQANWGLSMRAGKINSPWWTDHPELDIYGESSGFSGPVKGVEENYFSMGIQAYGRLYNGLIQGQFRESKVTYDFDETRHFLYGGWIAYTLTFKPGIRVRYFARVQSSELKQGEGNRAFYWAGFSFTQAFR